MHKLSAMPAHMHTCMHKQLVTATSYVTPFLELCLGRCAAPYTPQKRASILAWSILSDQSGPAVIMTDWFDVLRCRMDFHQLLYLSELPGIDDVWWSFSSCGGRALSEGYVACEGHRRSVVAIVWCRCGRFVRPSAERESMCLSSPFFFS